MFHGHAHHGRPEGHTSAGVPVYNVSLPLLRTAFPDRPAFRVLELPRPASNGQSPRTEAITDRVEAAGSR